MDWVYAVGHEHFTMSRPNALSMMRLLDRNSDGVLNLAEFREFAQACLDERRQRRARGMIENYIYRAARRMRRKKKELKERQHQRTVVHASSPGGPKLLV